MGVTQPYKRTIRRHIDGTIADSGKSQYISLEDYAEDPSHFIRAFELIHKDVQELFDYIEPSDLGEAAYSFRIHQLLVRTCIEVEANLKAILLENNYSHAGDLTMNHYCKVDKSHRLSEYEVRMPLWHGNNDIRKPFEEWKTQSTPSWYKTYHSAKHNRKVDFAKANFGTLIDAFTGLVALITSQFWTYTFSPGSTLLALNGSGPSDGFDDSILDYYRVKIPRSWTPAELYDFTHIEIQSGRLTCQDFPY